MIQDSILVCSPDLRIPHTAFDLNQEAANILCNSSITSQSCSQPSVIQNQKCIGTSCHSPCSLCTGLVLLYVEWNKFCQQARTNLWNGLSRHYLAWWPWLMQVHMSILYTAYVARRGGTKFDKQRWSVGRYVYLAATADWLSKFTCYETLPLCSTPPPGMDWSKFDMWWYVVATMPKIPKSSHQNLAKEHGKKGHPPSIIRSSSSSEDPPRLKTDIMAVFSANKSCQLEQQTAGKWSNRNCVFLLYDGCNTYTTIPRSKVKKRGGENRFDRQNVARFLLWRN
jgi:hypothetical protein